MKNKIIIGDIKVEEIKSDVLDECVKVSSDIEFVDPNTNRLIHKNCFFEYEKKYSKYITGDRSDSFVVGLLITAMENNYDIVFSNPISSRLYYQLSNYFIPLISQNNKNMNNIKIIGPTIDEKYLSESAIVTGCSGGVDSFYTMVKHESEKNFELTHIVYSSSGVEVYDSKIIKKNYKKNMELVKRISKESGLELICCYNNLYEFYKFPLDSFTTYFTPIFGSIAYNLQKLISIYYVSSGDPISAFNLDLSKCHGYDSSVFDVFTVSMMNTENLTFYSSGSEVDRNKKVEFISNSDVVKNNLLVCGAEINGYSNNDEIQNCSKCKKCVRTMFSLYSIGKLDNFKKVFDVEYFYNNKSKLLAKNISVDKKIYYKKSLENCKKNNIKIPLMKYVLYIFIYKPINILKKIFKNSKLAKKVYYFFKLDILVNGYSSKKSKGNKLNDK